MAFTVNLLNFAKRINSTAVPVGGGTSFSCNLKSSTSVHSPSFEFNFPMSTNPAQWNYVYVPLWGAYYFIEDWTFNDRLWIAACRMDVLATYRSSVMGTDAFVLYSQSDGNEYLTDQRIAPLNDEPDMFVFASAAPTSFSGVPNYVIRVIGANGGADGFVLDEAHFLNFGMVFGSDLTFKEQVTEQLGNAFGCVAGCMYFPFSVPVTSQSQPICLGQYQTNVYGDLMGSWNRVERLSLTIDKQWLYNDWRDMVYIDYWLYLPYVGVVELSAADVFDASGIGVDLSIDFISGSLAYLVTVDGAKIGTYTGKCGNTVQVTGYQSNALDAVGNAISGGISAIGNLATGNVGGLLMSGITGLAGTMQAAFTKTPKTMGGASGNAWQGLSNLIQVWACKHHTNIEPDTVAPVIGIPCMEVKRLGDLSGYVQTSLAAVEGTMDKTEKQEINALLDGGVFLE